MPIKRLLVVCAILVAAPVEAEKTCDENPTGIRREDRWIHFTMAGMPDPQFDGKPAKLHVRRVVPAYANGRCPSVVPHALVLHHGRSYPGPAAFDPRMDGRSEFSVMEALARRGIHTTTFSQLGYGRSTQPGKPRCDSSMPACDGSNGPLCEDSIVTVTVRDLQSFKADGQGLLPPTDEGEQYCAHTTDTRLANTRVFADALDLVVDDARADAGVDQVSILAWSAGGNPLGHYLDPDAPHGGTRVPKVKNAIFFAATFPTLGSRFAESPTDPTGLRFPSHAYSVERYPSDPDLMALPVADRARCARTIEPGLDLDLAIHRESVAQNSPDMGTTEDNPEGFNIAATFTRFGFNFETAHAITVPVMVFQGRQDPAFIPPTVNSCNIYRLTRTNTVLVLQDCAHHAPLYQGCYGPDCGTWGGPRQNFQDAVFSWVTSSTYKDRTRGEFLADGTGNVTVQAPRVTVVGANPLTVQCGAAFVDPGATALSAFAAPAVAMCQAAAVRNMTPWITATGTVSTGQVGSYTTTYAIDGLGTKTRTVNVVDTVAPSLSILGVAPAIITPADGRPVTVAVSFAAADGCSGVTVDGNGGDVPASAIVSHGDGTFTASFVVVAIPGSYTLSLQARDGAGNTSGVANASAIVP